MCPFYEIPTFWHWILTRHLIHVTIAADCHDWFLKILGPRWHANHDFLSFVVNWPPKLVIRRDYLKYIAGIFDPMGFTGTNSPARQAHFTKPVSRESRLGLTVRTTPPRKLYVFSSELEYDVAMYVNIPTVTYNVPFNGKVPRHATQGHDHTVSSKRQPPFHRYWLLTLRLNKLSGSEGKFSALTLR